MTSVSVSLEYTPGADNVALWLAQNLGYFRAAGITVSIAPYTVQTTSDTLVASGRTDIGISASEDNALIDCAQHRSVTAIYAITQRDPGEIGVAASSNITTPRQLDGTTYGGFGTPEEPLLMKALIRGDGGKGNFSDVTLGTASYQAVESGKVQSALFYNYSDAVQATLAGAHVRYFKFQQYGIPDQYGPVYIVNNGFLAQHPEVVRRFLAAVTKGYRYETTHQAAAAKLIQSLTQNQATYAFARASIAALLPLMTPPGGESLGHMATSQWAGRGNFFVHAGFLKDQDGATITAPLDYTRCFTNGYL